MVITIGVHNHSGKVGGTSRGVDTDPLSFPPPSLPRLPLLLHPCFPHSLPYSAFLLPLNLVRRSGEPCKLPVVRSEIMTAFAKVGRDQIHLVHMIYKVGGDASHGSHRLIAPMLINMTTTGNSCCP